MESQKRFLDTLVDELVDMNQHELWRSGHVTVVAQLCRIALETWSELEKLKKQVEELKAKVK